MDALGTESALQGPPEAVEARFQAYREAWKEAERLAGLDNPSWVAASVFSDLVVAALPLLDDGEVEWSSLVSTASAFQFWLAIEGVFVRGAMVRGDAWLDETIVYGPALLNANKLEEKVAVYPRVVIADNLQQQLRSYVPYYGGRVAGSPLDSQLLVDEAGTVFVDYLQNACVTPIREQQVDSLARHRTAVLSQLFETRLEPRAQDKMYWSARYHNYFVTTHFPNESQLLIQSRPTILEFSPLRDVWR